MEKLCKGMERRRDTPMDLRTLNTEGRKIEIQRAGWRTKLVNGNTTGSPTRPTSSTASNRPRSNLTLHIRHLLRRYSTLRHTPPTCTRHPP